MLTEQQAHEARWPEQAALAVLLLAGFAVRALHADQPIVENYVGRQVPTAMVARNLERGSGFLRPQLDTAPLPNLFLVEPPVYAAAVVALRRLTGLPLEPPGRLASALGLTLGAWGLFGLIRPREGSRAALLAVIALSVFPVTVRYGRAFQPDALMLGTLVAGLRCWDEAEAGGGAGWRTAGWLLLAICLALKVVAAYVFVPLLLVIVRPPRAWKVALALSALLPASLWYAHAALLLGEGQGSRASADNGAIWLRVLVPTALFQAATLGQVVRFTVVRAFTPLGFVLAAVGLASTTNGRRAHRGTTPPGPPFSRGGVQEGAPAPEAPSGRAAQASSPPFQGGARGGRAVRQYRAFGARAGAEPLWLAWGLAAVGTLVLLAAKLHHEYYWLALVPVAAVGVGRCLDVAARRTRAGAIVLTLLLVALAGFQSASTWRTPAEWATLPEAARAVRSHVPDGAWVVAPEALLYAADRRGCRLEIPRAAARRAAGEWGNTDLPEGPLALIEFYRARGARFVADVGDAAVHDPERLALHAAIRARYNVLVDTPGVLLAALTDRHAAREDADGTPR